MASIRSYFMARSYDVVMKKSEARCLGAWRSELLRNLSGDVLEIGSGTGVNLQFYPDAVRRLVLSESDANMRNQLRKKVQQSGRAGVSISTSSAESSEFPDHSFDYVVSTLVLCSVTSQQDSLREIRRVLRPGGHVVFLEHVAASKNQRLYRWQKIFDPLWAFILCNCHLTRDTEAMISDAGFELVSIERVLLAGVPSVVQPMIKGVARVA